MNRPIISCTMVVLVALGLPHMARTAEADAQPVDDTGHGPHERAVINFADLPHRIDSWQNNGAQGIYLKVGVREWYYASFLAPCLDLPFSEAIGIVTDGMNQVDRFSSIVVDGPSGLQRCWFKTFEKVDGPPARKRQTP